jgi:hypothetical protein
LWLRWTVKEKAWAGMPLPCDKVDVDLFNASTIVTIGNGKMADFWGSSWIEGQAPKNMAPNLYKKARRKNITVFKALRNNYWIRFCAPFTREEEVREFVSLWHSISSTHNLNDLDDTIIWRWSADGNYSSSSAYKIQFATNFCKIKINPIWKAKTEPKCRFFAWTLLHNKILTADNLQKRGWPCNHNCSLCSLSLETVTHLCKDCPFAVEVWSMILSWAELRFLFGISKTGTLSEWWYRLRMLCSKHSRKSFDGLLIYFWWSLWVERNNRIFKGQQRTTEQVVQMVKDFVGRGMAC